MSEDVRRIDGKSLPFRLVLDYTHTPDDRVRAGVFFDGQLTGQLLLNVGEAQLLAAALGLGADHMRGHLTVTVRGYLSREWAAEQDRAGKMV